MAGNQSNKCSCTACGTTFTLTGIEIRFYTEQDIPLPNRCRACAREQSGGEAVYANAPRIVQNVSAVGGTGLGQRILGPRIAANLSAKTSKTH